MRLRTVLEALFEWMTAPSLGCGAFIFVTKYTAARWLCISSFIFAIFLSLLFIIILLIIINFLSGEETLLFLGRSCKDSA